MGVFVFSRWSIAVAVAVIASLVAVSSASATTVSRDQGGIRIIAVAGEDNWYSVGHIPRNGTYCPGSPRGCFTVNDLNPNPTLSGPGCFIESGTPGIVRCKDPGGRVPITVKAGDLDDSIGMDASDPRPNEIFGRIYLGNGNDSASTGPGDDRIFGGPGNESFGGGGSGLYGGGGDDLIEGGAGDDRLDGEAGADRIGASDDTGDDGLFGGGGSDFLDARDGFADSYIDCGAGRRDDARRDSGLDPEATSC